MSDLCYERIKFSWSFFLNLAEKAIDEKYLKFQTEPVFMFWLENFIVKDPNVCRELNRGFKMRHGSKNVSKN